MMPPLRKMRCNGGRTGRLPYAAFASEEKNAFPGGFS
jgi:hypothetical protein